MPQAILLGLALAGRGLSSGCYDCVAFGVGGEAFRCWSQLLLALLDLCLFAGQPGVLGVVLGLPSGLARVLHRLAFRPSLALSAEVCAQTCNRRQLVLMPEMPCASLKGRGTTAL